MHTSHIAPNDTTSHHRVTEYQSYIRTLYHYPYYQKNIIPLHTMQCKVAKLQHDHRDTPPQKFQTTPCFHSLTFKTWFWTKYFSLVCQYIRWRAFAFYLMEQPLLTSNIRYVINQIFIRWSFGPPWLCPSSPSLWPCDLGTKKQVLVNTAVANRCGGKKCDGWTNERTDKTFPGAGGTQAWTDWTAIVVFWYLPLPTLRYRLSHKIENRWNCKPSPTKTALAGAHCAPDIIGLIKIHPEVSWGIPRYTLVYGWVKRTGCLQNFPVFL